MVPELAQDVFCIPNNIDAEAELTAILSEQIKLLRLTVRCGDCKGTLRSTLGCWVGDVWLHSTTIHRKTKSGVTTKVNRCTDSQVNILRGGVLIRKRRTKRNFKTAVPSCQLLGIFNRLNTQFH